MEIVLFLIGCFILYLIIYTGVSEAIKPLIDANNKNHRPELTIPIAKMNAIGVLTNKEIEEYRSEIKSIDNFERSKMEYLQYKSVLGVLKSSGRISEDEYIEKHSKLTEYYGIQ